MAVSIEIGVDIGGTFTDLVCRAEGVPDRTLKVPSTPEDPAREDVRNGKVSTNAAAAVYGLREAGD